MKRKAAWMLGSIVTLVCSGIAHAQVLADKVPADAVAYFGWAGADAVKAKYEGTHLQAILKESRFEELFGSYLDQVEASVVKREPQAAEPMRLLRTLGKPMWTSPTAIYIGNVDASDKRRPHFTIAMISQVGDKAESMAKDVAKLLPPPRSAGQPTLTVYAENGVITYLITSEETSKLDLTKGTLAQAQTFANNFKQVKGDPIFTTFIDFASIMSTVEEGIAANAAEAAPKAKAFLDNSGLRGLKQLISTSGFQGKDWVTETFIATDGQRAGLLKAMPSGAVDANLLKIVPGTANSMGSFRFDPAALTGEMRNTLAKTDEQALQFYNYGFGAMQQALGANVEQAILTPLGSDWVCYTAPELGSGGILGIVLVNKLDDPAAMQKGLSTVAFNFTRWVNIGISKASREAQVNLKSVKTKIGNTEVNYLATPFFAPSWAIDDGKLYIGLYPQVVGAAIRQAHSGKPSILESEKYKAALATLKQDKLESVSFYDLPTAARHGSMYNNLLLISRYAGFADLFVPPLPEPLFPPIDVVLDHLAPAVSGSWSDSTGIHMRRVQSFPGSMLLNEQSAAISAGAGSAGLMTSILLPSLNRARETANRVKSASNLRMIGQAILLHSNENRGKYPDTLAPLLTGQELAVQVFDNPRNGDLEIPADIINDPEALGLFVNDNGDYIYVGAGKDNRVPADVIIAYENPEGLEDGINILFGDGHVEFILMEQALQMIEEQKQAAGGV